MHHTFDGFNYIPNCILSPIQCGCICFLDRVSFVRFHHGDNSTGTGGNGNQPLVLLFSCNGHFPIFSAIRLLSSCRYSLCSASTNRSCNSLMVLPSKCRGSVGDHFFTFTWFIVQFLEYLTKFLDCKCFVSPENSSRIHNFYGVSNHFNPQISILPWSIVNTINFIHHLIPKRLTRSHSNWLAAVSCPCQNRLSMHS